MNNIELLVLNGSPGSGKSTLMDAISEYLRAAKVTCAVIDVDEIARVYLSEERPFEWKKEFMWANLKAIWPNYIAIGDIKIIIPCVLDDEVNLEALKDATPDSKLTICKLVVPLEVLKQRVSEREPNDYWRERLNGLVDQYNQQEQSNPGKYADFEVSTHNKSVEETTIEIITKLGWL
jgi:tRNA uridine 5-carbamoylmethylation protein Kti12